MDRYINSFLLVLSKTKCLCISLMCEFSYFVISDNSKNMQGVTINRY